MRSQENLEVVRATWNAWLRGDLDGVLANVAPDAVWDMTPFREWPERQYIGPEGVRLFLSEWLDIWDAFEAGVEELRLAADGRVVALAWQRGSGRRSGLAMDMDWGQVITVRDRMITKVESYDDSAKALKAVGLSE
ncbi:MAG: uncharacterized protein QOD71_525 [Thermoleophilaceae bacterium]|jgi:ketosteroid isomerase-like protein|nr:uncharacterized protein [Thermoleophilaceae bacterium]